MQLCLKCRALSQILIVSSFQTSALQEIPFFGFFKGPLLSTKAGEPVIIFSILCMEHEKGHETAYNCTKSLEDE